MKDTKYYEMYHKAYVVANKAHKGQRDKAGKYYFLHPYRVAKALENHPSLSLLERIQCATVGLLHDVVEDSYITLEDLRNEGFTENILFAIDCLTRRKDETYQEFIVRCTLSPIALNVKIEDLKDNLDITRLEKIDEKDVERINRYLEALRFLQSTRADQVNP